MTLMRQLFSLQELDLALDSVRSRKARAEEELETRLTLGKIEQGIEEEQAKLEEFQAAHRDHQLEAETLRERVSHLETQLFGDTANPRDLEVLQLEVNNVRAQVDQKDLQLLELSVRADDARRRISALQEELTEARESWELRQAELLEEVAVLTEEETGLAAQRAELAGTLDQAEVTKYDTLRRSKGGTAVAKVERGLCQGCRMSLPTQHLQRVRSGRYTVNCSSCGRMLFPG